MDLDLFGLGIDFVKIIVLRHHRSLSPPFKHGLAYFGFRYK
jgi:hypothetical protein